MQTFESERIDCIVRRLNRTDLDRVVALDAQVGGRERRGYFEHKLEVNLLDTSVQVSLGAEIDRILVGFLLARVWTGEFGSSDQVAVLDTIGVQPAFQQRGIGDALLEQLVTNLHCLKVGILRTEVAWDRFDLLRFFHHHGFQPAPRLCLDLDLSKARE